MPQVVGAAALPSAGVAGPAGGWLFPGARTSPSREFDLPALERVELALIINFVGALVGAALIYGIGPLYGFSPLNATSETLASSRAVEILAVAAVAGLAVSVIALALFRTAFTRLREVDTGFSTPASLLRMGIVGLFILMVGLPIVFAAIGPVVNSQCLGPAGNSTGMIPPSCSHSAEELLAGGALSLLGGVLALIGYVGLLLGLWRLGGRYGSDLIKAGTIVTIFIPYVGLPLLWWGCRQVRPRLVGPSATYR